MLWKNLHSGKAEFLHETLIRQAEIRCSRYACSFTLPIVRGVELHAIKNEIAALLEAVEGMEGVGVAVHVVEPRKPDVLKTYVFRKTAIDLISRNQDQGSK